MNWYNCIYDFESVLRYFGAKWYMKISEARNEIIIYGTKDICYMETLSGVPKDIKTCKKVIVKLNKTKVSFYIFENNKRVYTDCLEYEYASSFDSLCYDSLQYIQSLL